MLTKLHRKNFDEKGWVKIKGFFSKKEIQSINNRINLFLKKNLKKYEGRDVNFSKEDINLNEINSFHKLSDAKWLRLLAKKKGDFKLADEIRNELLNKGIIIEDQKEKTIWKYK